MGCHEGSKYKRTEIQDYDRIGRNSVYDHFGLSLQNGIRAMFLKKTHG